MTRRREFPRKIKAQIILRATNERGQVVCEGCGLVLGKKRYEIDHRVPEALRLSDAKPLTAEDGKLLGRDCCHKPKTADDIRKIRKADRVRDRDTGAFPKAKRPIPGSRNSPFKIKMDGTVERRT